MLKEIFAVSNYPYLQKDGDFVKKLATLFKTYGLLLLAMIAVGPVLLLADAFVTHVLHHKSLNHQSLDMLKRFFKKVGYTVAFIFACIIGPLFEELMFRLPLTFKRRQVAVTIIIAVFYGGAAFLQPKAMEPWLVILIILAFIIAVIRLFFIPNTPIDISLQTRRLLISLSIALFGLMHISNYTPIDWPLIWIYPLFVVPQMLIGWGITYVRFKSGFAWGLALHCLVNTVSTLLAFGIGK